MNIVDEYRRITELIAVQKSQLATAKRDLQRNMNIYKPSDTKGIDYSQDKVQSSMQQQNIFTTAKNISILTNFIKEVTDELEQLNQQQRELEETINKLGDTKKKTIIYSIKGIPSSKIAKKVHVSERTVRRYLKETTLL